jgi:hypothetical protein
MNVGSLKRRIVFLTCLASLFGGGALSANRTPVKSGRVFVDCSVVTNDMIKANLTTLLNDPNFGVPGLGVIYDLKVKKPTAKFTGKVRNSDDERHIVILADRVDCIDIVDTSGLKVACSDAKAQFNATKLLELLPCAIQEGAKPVRVTVSGGVAALTGEVPSKKYKRAARSLVEAADCVDKVDGKNLFVVPPATQAEVPCNQISDAVLATTVKSELMARLSCAASKFIRVVSANKVITLTGATVENGNYAAKRIAKSVRCVVDVISMIAEGLPQCPQGALSCMTADGEQWCCFGCRRCPLSY